MAPLLMLALSFGVVPPDAHAQTTAKPAETQVEELPEEENDVRDPLEWWNRNAHKTNLALDRAVLGPVARAYLKTPRFLRARVGNFLDNLGYPKTAINAFLQGKFEQGTRDTMRLVFNTTLGLFGFIDIASAVGLEKNDEDFGQTLAVWGVDEGFYVEYLVFGPNTLRDTADIPVGWRMTLLTLDAFDGWFLPITALRVVHTRAELDELIRLRDRSAADTYIFTREGYRQRREYLIHDGDPPLKDDGVFGMPDMGEDEEAAANAIARSGEARRAPPHTTTAAGVR